VEQIAENSRKSRRKYWILFTALLLLTAALILPPLINMNRYQRRIAEAIGNSLGRRVHLSSVTLRLLPRPGLELSDFLVEEDPTFGAEPTLRAQSVDASIRLTSLWRGRLEIARISFDQPSLNLVRNNEGRWNIGAVLLQASHIPNAPTAQRRAGSSPRFPYIEASNARVNFKIGNEKKPFSLFNADFAMWLANPDEWRLRLEAQPVRTDLDLDLSDTGLLRVEGSLHRASAIGEMPIDLQSEWSSAPLGQIARLLIGRDTDWRGNLEITGTIKGNVFNPQFKTRIRIAGIHRQEFAPREPFNVDANCQGDYQHGSRSLVNLTCLWPIDNGHLLLTGSVPDTEYPKPSFHLHIQDVPTAFGLSALRLFRNGFASSTQVSGTIQGSLDYTKAPVESLSGNATINGLTVRTSSMATPIVLPTLQFSTASALSAQHRPLRRKATPINAPLSLHLASASIPLGEEPPLTVSGDFNRENFSLHFTGNASLEQLHPITANLGLLRNIASALASQGTAVLDLTIRGPWIPPTVTLGGPARPAVTTEGSLRLKNAKYQASFLPEPLEILSAQAALTPERIVWNPVSIIFHKIPATLSLTSPVPCNSPACIREFSLSMPQLDAAALQSSLMGGGEHGEFLQQILETFGRTKIQWPALNGTIRAAIFTLGALTLRDASCSLHIEGRHVQFTSVEAHALNGILEANGSMDATGRSPHYSIDARLLHANTAGLATLWREPPLSGTITANTHLELAGYSTDELAQSAQGTFHWDWTQGMLTLVPAALTHFDHWSADGTIKNRQFSLTDSQVVRGPIKQTVAGTISFDRHSDLTITNQEVRARVATATPHIP
jgi:hypothetical protein